MCCKGQDANRATQAATPTSHNMLIVLGVAGLIFMNGAVVTVVVAVVLLALLFIFVADCASNVGLC